MADGERVSVRVGADLVEIDEVADAVSAHGSRYLGRVYTDREVAACRRRGTIDPRLLAMQFAAKEAVVKLLRPDREPIPWRSIEMLADADTGQPKVVLSGAADALARAEGVSGLSISVSRQGEIATAIAIAQVAFGAQA